MDINFKEHLILSALYNLRCLTFKQIYDYVFDGLSERTCANVLSAMSGKKGFISKIGYHNNSAYFVITNKGIKQLKLFGVISLAPSKHNTSTRYQMLSASDIKLNSLSVPHQLSLNQFVIDFIKRYPDCDFEYFDEKYISRIFSDIRPDGIIKTQNTLFFLEMDMNTERQSRLLKKWESYRKFLNSGDYYNNCSTDIKVLFILENVSDNSKRKYSLRNYIDVNLRSEINPSFNIYVNKKEELFNVLDALLNKTSFPLSSLFENKGFSVEDNYNLDGYFFDKYIYKLKNEEILEENGELLEFIVDDFSFEDIYSYKKFLLYPKLNTIFNNKYGYDIKYLFIVNSVKDAVNMLNNTNGYNYNIYFTTPERLSKYTFYSAIFKIERNGILYHFLENNLKVKQEEAYISDVL